MSTNDMYDYAAMARAILAVKADAGGPFHRIEALLPLVKARRVSLKKHELIAHQGERATYFGLVLSGALQMSIRTPAGDRCLMSVIRPGEYAGHSLLFLEDPIVPCDVEAFPSCELIIYDLAAVNEVKLEPEFQPWLRMLQQHVGRSLILAWQRGFVISQRMLVDRVMAYLQIRSAETGSMNVVIPGTMDDWADYLACNRAALSRAISKLSAEGRIEIVGRSHIRLLPSATSILPAGDGRILPNVEQQVAE